MLGGRDINGNADYYEEPSGERSQDDVQEGAQQDVPAEAPAEAPADALADAPAEAPADAPEDASDDDKTANGTEQFNVLNPSRQPILEVCRLIRSEAYPLRYFDLGLFVSPSHSADAIPAAAKAATTELSIYWCVCEPLWVYEDLIKKFPTVTTYMIEAHSPVYDTELEVDTIEVVRDGMVLGAADAALDECFNCDSEDLEKIIERIFGDKRIVLHFKVQREDGEELGFRVSEKPLIFRERSVC